MNNRDRKMIDAAYALFIPSLPACFCQKRFFLLALSSPLAWGSCVVLALLHAQTAASHHAVPACILGGSAVPMPTSLVSLVQRITLPQLPTCVERPRTRRICAYVPCHGSGTRVFTAAIQHMLR
eukprot:scaffold216228_cov15-Prasinocladus_malaysianus.AAC.1